jgi:hypothetical protein
LALRFLGFNSSARPLSKEQTSLNISLDEVRRMGNVDQRSEIIGDDFIRLAQSNTVAYSRAIELGPYDVINLDLCGGFTEQDPGKLKHTYYDAVNSLLSLQARYPRPWLLFLTTRADRATIDDNVLQILQEKYIANLDNCEEFRDASMEKFSISSREELADAAQTERGLLPIFLTGLFKWFLGLALAQQPQTSVSLSSVIGYKVCEKSACEDLISLALRFTPTFNPVVDTTGLANPDITGLDEGRLATKGLKRIAKRTDADKCLAEREDIKKEMTEATALLLKQARYDPQAYKEWVLNL